MSPDFRSLPVDLLNSGESSYLKVGHGVAQQSHRLLRLLDLVRIAELT